MLCRTYGCISDRSSDMREHTVVTARSCLQVLAANCGSLTIDNCGLQKVGWRFPFSDRSDISDYFSAGRSAI